jgi:spoIIIJ-associated protein
MEKRIEAAIESYLKELLSVLEEEASFEMEEDSDEEIYINLTGNLFSLPEERPILTALEHLLRVSLHRKTGKDCGIVIDVNGAVKRRRAELIRFALSAAESVRREHKRIRLNPMPPRERRTIHITLANFPGVKTYSIGQSDSRRVVIEPDET